MIVVGRGGRPRRRREPGLRAWLTWIVVLVLLSPATARAAGDAPPEAGATVAGYLAQFSPAEVETEIVAFSLHGRKRLHRLDIADLDAALTPTGRFLPLFRLLEELEIPFHTKDAALVFQPPAAPSVRLDPGAGRVWIGDQELAATMVVGISDITLRPELYLPADVVTAVLPLSLAWDEATYAFHGQTETMFPLWRPRKRQSLLAERTREIRVQVPELYPPAVPPARGYGVDFVEFKGKVQADLVREGGRRRIRASGLEETAWGPWASGRYKITFAQAPLSWEEDELRQLEDPLFRLRWGHWRQRRPGRDLEVGDATLGMQDLVFPSLRLAGIATRGVILGPDNAVGKGIDPWNLDQLAGRAYSFADLAPVGSQVELFINDRLVDTDQVDESDPASPGFGLYRFENVRLAPGVLNVVKIRITDPDQVVTVLERQLAGHPRLLPRGVLSYNAAAGTNRRTNDWHAYGLVTAGSMTYGWRDSLTVGTTAAYQHGYHTGSQSFTSDDRDRPYPRESYHLGFDASWQPLDRLAASLALAGTSARFPTDDSSTTGLGLTAQLETYPAAAVLLQGRFFRYSNGFFDGQTRQLHDRQGFILATNATLDRGITFQASGGRIWDDVGNHRPQRRGVTVLHADIRTSRLSRTTLKLSLDGVHPSWEQGPRTLYAVEASTRLASGWRFSGYLSSGDDISLGQDYDFLTGLRLPGITLSESRHTSLTAGRDLPWGGSLGFSYWKAGVQERYSLIHTMASPLDLPLRLRTEIGYEVDYSDLYLEHRAEYTLPLNRRTTAGLRVRHSRQEWLAEAYLATTLLFHHQDGELTEISDSNLRPERAGVSGTVFIDADGDGVKDPEERGFAGMRIYFNGRYTKETGADGSFSFPAPARSRVVEVVLDLDTVPAIYTCIHGRQTAYLEPEKLTTVNLILVPVHAVSGYVLGETEGGEQQGVAGVRVVARHKKSGAEAGESITAGDGSFYIGDLRPGKYFVEVDGRTLPPGTTAAAYRRVVAIDFSDEPQEVYLDPFLVTPAAEEGTDDEEGR